MTAPRDRRGQGPERDERLAAWLRGRHAHDDLWRSAVDEGLQRTDGIAQRRGWRARGAAPWRWAAGTASLAILAALAFSFGGGFGLLTPGTSPGSSAAVSLPPADALERHVATSAPVPVAEPVSARIAAGGLWVATLGGSVYRLDQRTGAIQSTITLPGNACGPLTDAAGLLWVRVCASGPSAAASSTHMVAINPTDATTALTLTFAGRAGGSVAELDGSVWVIADEGTGTLQKIDPSTGTVGDTRNAGARVTDVVAWGGDLWLAAPDDKALLHLARGTAAPPDVLALGDAPSSLLATRTEIWAGLGTTGEIVRLDPLTTSITARIPLGDVLPVQLVANGDQLLVLSRRELSRIDAATGAVVGRISLGTHAIAFAPQFEGPNLGLAAEGATVWFVPARGDMVRLIP